MNRFSCTWRAASSCWSNVTCFVGGGEAAVFVATCFYSLAFSKITEYTVFVYFYCSNVAVIC